MDSLFSTLHDPATREVVQHFVDGMANSGGSALGKAGGSWLYERFRRFASKHLTDEEPETQFTSMERLVAFYEALDTRLVALESRGATTDNLKAAFSDPQASRLIDAACVAATETSDRGKSETLAYLVAQRVVAGSETRYALYLRRATEAVRDLQPRHLAILAEMFLIQEVPFPVVPDIAASGFGIYNVWLGDALQRLDVADVSNEDMEYLQSLGMVVPANPSVVIENSERLLTHENAFIQSLIVRGLPENLIRSSDAVKRAARLLDARTDAFDRDFAKIALGDYRLTGQGEVLAVTVMRQRGVGTFRVNLDAYASRGDVPTYRALFEERLATSDTVECVAYPAGTAPHDAAYDE